MLDMESFDQLTLFDNDVTPAIPSSSGPSPAAIEAGQRFAACLRADGLDELADEVWTMLGEVD